MNGFDLYEYIKYKHPQSEEIYLSPERTAELIEKCESSFRANCGELKRLSHELVRKAIIKLIKRGNLFETTCGKLIHGEEAGRNLLIEDLIKEGLLGKGGHINHTNATTLEQTFLGMTHMFVFDNGKLIFIEKPHGCINHDQKPGFLLENEMDLAQELMEMMWKNLNYSEILPDQNGEIGDSIKENIIVENDEKWKQQGFEYDDEEEFQECMIKALFA